MPRHGPLRPRRAVFSRNDQKAQSGIPQSSGRVYDISGSRARAGDRLSLGNLPQSRHVHENRARFGDVSADEAHAELRASVSHPFRELFREAVGRGARIAGGAEQEPGDRPHGSDVAQGNADGLFAYLSRGHVPRAEMNILDENVGGSDQAGARLETKHGRVVSYSQRDAVAGGGREPLGQKSQGVGFTHLRLECYRKPPLSVNSREAVWGRRREFPGKFFLDKERGDFMIILRFPVGGGFFSTAVFFERIFRSQGVFRP